MRPTEEDKGEAFGAARRTMALAPDRRAALVRSLFAVVIGFGAIYGLKIHLLLWDVDAAGVSPIALKLPTWDFTNLWMGGRLALEGRLDALFAPDAYRQALEATLGRMPYASEWSYPPSLLLVAAPLALLPLAVAYWAWTAFGWAFLTAVLRAAGMERALCVAVALSPALAFNAMFGQNAAVTAALAIGGLLCARDRPVLAGLCFALLTMKPQMGVLIPVCLVAAGCWRAIGWTAAFATLLLGVTTLAFGAGAWGAFLSETQPLMRSILEAPYGQLFHSNAVTTFMLVRSLGGDVTTAYALQLPAAIASAWAAWTIWRRPTEEPLLRAALIPVLTLLASPYAWAYDMVACAVVTALLAPRAGPFMAVFLAAMWLWPFFTEAVANHFLPVTPLLLAALCALGCREVMKGASLANPQAPEAPFGAARAAV